MVYRVEIVSELTEKPITSAVIDGLVPALTFLRALCVHLPASAPVTAQD